MSLRSRLLAAVGLVALLALVAADVATYSSLRSFLLSRVDQSLENSHVPIEQALTGDGGPPGGADFPSRPDGGGGLLRLAPGTFVEVRSSTGQVLLSQPAYERGGTGYSPRLPTRITGFSSTVDPRGEPTVYFDAPSAASGGPAFRVRASRISGPGQTGGPGQFGGAGQTGGAAQIGGTGQVLVLAVSLADTDGTLHRLLFIELAVTAGALLLAGGAGWWLVRLGMRPLLDIEGTAERIAAGELGSRIPGDERRTEVGRLARVLNVMLGRIEAAFAERDTTEAALRESESRLRRFVADASHELRTPIAAVSAYAELFGRGARSKPEDLDRVMTGIRSETGRMSHLVEDLLLLARMDEGLPLEPARLELVGLAAEAVQAAAAVGPEWGVSLRADRPVEVTADRNRMRQVLDNLLANVRAHTPPGTTAVVEVAEEGGEAVIRVRDDGPGLTPEQADQVFERFYRADTSRARSSGGAGLGLSIVAAIVAAHGGSVAARPAPGGGALFEIRIPAPAA